LHKLLRVPGLAFILAAPLGASALAAEPTVIELTQTACQFVESENNVDHKFTTRKKADCEAINSQSGAARLAKAEPLKLKPGKYIFRVKNKNVPYSLGFWVRDKDYDWRNPLHKLTKTSVSGGGLTTGKTQEYEVELEAGEYVYSCPLNTTPDYRLIVGG
jgi:hypothetical protein